MIRWCCQLRKYILSLVGTSQDNIHINIDLCRDCRHSESLEFNRTEFPHALQDCAMEKIDAPEESNYWTACLYPGRIHLRLQAIVLRHTVCFNGVVYLSWRSVYFPFSMLRLVLVWTMLWFLGLCLLGSFCLTMQICFVRVKSFSGQSIQSLVRLSSSLRLSGLS